MSEKHICSFCQIEQDDSELAAADDSYNVCICRSCSETKETTSQHSSTCSFCEEDFDELLGSDGKVICNKCLGIAKSWFDGTYVKPALVIIVA